jgi:dihydrofolate reductase
MRISIIVAMDRKRGIGYQGGIPWYLSADLRRFRKLTTGHHVLFCRKTYESIGRPLPERRIIVLTRKKIFQASDVVFTTDNLNKAIDYAIDMGETELFIGGGSQIYEQVLTLVDRIYLTFVHTTSDVDTLFPIVEYDEWETTHVEHIPRDEKNEYASTFIILERVSD